MSIEDFEKHPFTLIMDKIRTMFENNTLFDAKDNNDRYKVMGIGGIKTYLDKNYPKRKTEIIDIIEKHKQ